MAIVIGLATFKPNSTRATALKGHAIDTESVKALCSSKMSVLTYTPTTAATSANVDCVRCQRKLVNA
jgi:hypothetical protein